MTGKLTARQKILDATENLLATEGLLAVNTNRVADEAQVNISTLYKNFSNKVDILAELLRTFESARTQHIARWNGTISSQEDWDRWASDTVEAMARFRRERPAARNLRAAIKVHPELAQVDAESTSAAVEYIIQYLPQPVDSNAKESLISFLELASQTMSMVLDETSPDTEEGRRRIDALTAFICGGYGTVTKLTSPAVN